MTEQSVSVATEQKSTKLPLRDWILLPAIGLFTVLSVAGVTEFVAQRKYYTTKSAGGSCTVFNDPVVGPHGKPNCIVSSKIPETELTQYRFNDCGYRTDLPCGPKPPRTFRIVMIGTSVAGGWSVPVEKTFADILPAKLSHSTGRSVQIYNESFPYRYPDFTARNFGQILKAQPDMILWALNPHDLERQAVAEIPHDNAEAAMNSRQRFLRDLKDALASGSTTKMISNLFTHTRTYNLLFGFIYASPSQYLKVALADPDRVMGYLKVQPSETWQQKYKNFDEDFGRVAAQAQAAHVPLVVTCLPSRASAAMIATGTPPPGYDPYLIDSRLQSIATSHGATYIAIAPDLRAYPNPQLGFYPTEGHPNARGHAMFADILAQKLPGIVAADAQATTQHN
jgi:hypothetical protein